MREKERPELVSCPGPLIVLLLVLLLCVQTIGNPANDERETETRTGILQGPLIVLLLPV